MMAQYMGTAGLELNKVLRYTRLPSYVADVLKANEYVVGNVCLRRIRFYVPAGETIL